MAPDAARWVCELEEELLRNIVPFWASRAFEGPSGGLIGGLTHDGRLLDLPRSSVLAARLLWTFSSVGLAYPCRTEAERCAREAYRVLTDRHRDPGAGGFWWSVDAHGRPIDRRKHTYAQAFAVYGLVAYWRLAGCEDALNLATELFRRVQAHAWDASFGGYREGCAEDWTELDDHRLSEKEPNVPKTMNTHLHVLEAWTELWTATRSPEVRSALEDTLAILADRMFDPALGHFAQFFRSDWSPIPSDVSYGHDIEAAWLLRRAASRLGSEEATRSTDGIAAQVAERVLRVALREDGAFLYAGTPETPTDASVEWWAQAEAIVGFLDAYEATKDDRFLGAAERVWRFVRRHVSDREGGDWIKSQTADLRLKPKSLRIGPWECPYHHARMCLEAIHRLRAL
ncbi:MAG: AGE family epimerase/isomerase [Fimbriimonadales bacterium]|nr:AGE family epimerase/isomerase [Fimbriimonadales bacterium]